jgi:hypothetical protein
MIVEDQSEVIDCLSRAETFGMPGETVERIETHASVIFLVGDRAFKLKRAVRYPYLDYSTPDRRRRFCEAEVEINRRSAPELYRGVIAVRRDRSGRLRLDGEGEPVDWLVEMVQFDLDLSFDRLAAAGRLDRFVMETVADEIARFHGQAEVRAAPDAAGRIAEVIANNHRSFLETPAGILDRGAIEALSAAARHEYERCADVLRTRADRGLVRRCHGDLHLRNIVVHRGRPLLFDAIEFDDRLAEIDVLYDLAFLVMDLEFRGLGPLASILLNRYLDATGDSGGLSALPLFLSVRAAIRAHVDAAAAGAQSAGEAGRALAAGAARYLDLARAFLVPRSPRLIAIGGLSGTGKSRLARHLAPRVGVRPGARVVRTDATRKRLAGVSLATPLDPGRYTAESSRRTYEVVFAETRLALAAGHSVIADAVFARPEERRAIAAVAAECGVPFAALWLEAPGRLLEERVTRRRHNVSDANAVVVRMQLAYDLGEIDWPRLETSADGEAVVEAAARRLGIAGG